MKMSPVRWATPALALFVVIALGGCCEDEMETGAPKNGKDTSAVKKGDDKAVAKSADAGAQKGDDKADRLADSKEDAKKEDVKEETPDRFLRNEETHKKYKEMMKLEKDWELDYINLAKGKDLLVAVKEGSKGAAPQIRAAIAGSEEIHSEIKDFAAFTGADKEDTAKLKACKMWFGAPGEAIELSKEKKALKISFWCSLSDDLSAPPTSVEMVVILKIDQDIRDIKALERIWSGIGGSSKPHSEKCVHHTTATFTAPAPGVIQQTNTTNAELFGAVTPDNPLPPDEEQALRDKCTETAPKEPIVTKHALK